MQRYVLEPILFAIFGELLSPVEPVEYLMPYSTIAELYELRESEQIVTAPEQNVQVKQNLNQLIEFFEQPFVRKKIDRALRMPWQKSPPILMSEQVTLTVVHALDNAVYGEKFDPIETELILLALREQIPCITDQLSFRQHVQEQRIPVIVLDISEFGFLVENSTDEWLEADNTQAATEQRVLPFAQEEKVHFIGRPVSNETVDRTTIDRTTVDLSTEEKPKAPQKNDLWIPLLLLALFVVVIFSWFLIGH